jgi:signal transduction histidine kinase
MRQDRPYIGPAPSGEDLRRSEARMVVARWVATPWVFLQVLIYQTLPYPPGVRLKGLLLAGLLPLANLLIWVLLRRASTYRQSLRLAVGGLVLDVLIASGFVWLFAFDQVSAVWAALFILPLEGALLFSMLGALGSWALVCVLYVAREVWASHRYGFPVLVDSISFRMGIGLLIALVAGLMARDLLRQRSRLRETLEELRRVDALRSTMVSTLAHDVRNALSAIRGAVQTLVGRGTKIRAADRAAMLQIADRQAERLQGLAEGLLDLARLNQGSLPLDLRDVPLRAAVEQALTFVGDGGEVEVRIPADVVVRADAARLEQVIVNLSSNAARHGGPPFVIEATRNDGWVRVEFRDSGPGVPMDRRATLFEPFRGGDGAGSVGFGLAIVRGLVEVHGGRITFMSNQPRGSRFLVELPAGGTDPISP